jgi:hypothetical protein
MPPDKPMERRVQDHPIPTIESLRKHLHLAMQLEHATIPPYLTALYSIKPGSNPDVVQVLRVVAVEEMLHLVLAANILNAVGGTPCLTTPDFVPHYPARLPDGETDFEVSLQSFSCDALQTFLKIERPIAMAPTPDKRVIRRPYQDGRRFLAAHPDGDDLHYYSIGEFYRAIEEALQQLDQAADRTIFTGDKARQVAGDHYYSGGGKLFPVTDLETARRAINAIISQGEGEDRGIYGRDGELAHYYRFKQLEYGRYYQTADDTRGQEEPQPNGPTLTVRWDAVYPIKQNAKLADYESGSEAYAAAAAFNQAYDQFLRELERAFNGNPDQLTTAVHKMFDLRNKVNQLIRNPLKDGSAFNAAPTFEVGAKAGVSA